MGLVYFFVVFQKNTTHYSIKFVLGDDLGLIEKLEKLMDATFR